MLAGTIITVRGRTAARIEIHLATYIIKIHTYTICTAAAAIDFALIDRQAALLLHLMDTSCPEISHTTFIYSFIMCFLFDVTILQQAAYLISKNFAKPHGL
jgi:hypothetical protein